VAAQAQQADQARARVSEARRRSDDPFRNQIFTRAAAAKRGARGSFFGRRLVIGPAAPSI